MKHPTSMTHSSKSNVDMIFIFVVRSDNHSTFPPFYVLILHDQRIF